MAFDGTTGLANRRGQLVLTSLDVWQDAVAGVEQLLEVFGLAAHTPNVVPLPDYRKRAT